jgi:large subunit ribosomal protein L15
MKYHELEATPNHDRKRVGRGISAGQGKTAGRGTKGQGARTGKKLGHGFMGGQGPLVRRIPKSRGFKSMRVPAQVVYLDQLNGMSGDVDNHTLATSGLIATPHHSVKVIAARLGREFNGTMTLRVQAASASVVSVLEAAGGRFEATPVPLPPTADPKKIDKREKKAAKATEA